jgi:hypothetical protein
MPQTPTAEYIGAAEAARRLGIDRSTFNKQVRMGAIPTALKLPGRTGARLFDPAVIDRLAQERAA